MFKRVISKTTIHYSGDSMYSKKTVGLFMIVVVAVLFFTSIGHSADQFPNDINEAGKTNSPRNERVDNAIDGSDHTKFLNFEGKNGASGFYLSFSCKVNLDTITFVTANDHPGRDPYLLDVFGCHHGMSDKVKSGCRRLGNDSVTVEKADKPYAEVSAHFTNDKSFSYYKVMITAIRNRSENSFQFAEVWGSGSGKSCPGSYLGHGKN
tara:strand:- start:76 stop:699 length:624 start_codon:yes stop_codon:yes gene_type:complete